MLPVLAIEKCVILKMVVRVPNKIVEQQPTRHLESLLRRTLGNCINKLGDDLNIANFGMRISVFQIEGKSARLTEILLVQPQKTALAKWNAIVALNSNGARNLGDEGNVRCRKTAPPGDLHAYEFVVGELLPASSSDLYDMRGRCRPKRQPPIAQSRISSIDLFRQVPSHLLLHSG